MHVCLLRKHDILKVLLVFLAFMQPMNSWVSVSFFWEILLRIRKSSKARLLLWKCADEVPQWLVSKVLAIFKKLLKALAVPELGRLAVAHSQMQLTLRAKVSSYLLAGSLRGQGFTLSVTISSNLLLDWFLEAFMWAFCTKSQSAIFSWIWAA